MKNKVAMWGILPKGVIKLEKSIVKENVASITRSRKYYKPSFLERGYLDRDIREGSKPTKLKVKEEKEEEDRVLTQLKKNQAYVPV